jgi:hypothetical protein
MREKRIKRALEATYKTIYATARRNLIRCIEYWAQHFIMRIAHFFDEFVMLVYTLLDGRN